MTIYLSKFTKIWRNDEKLTNLPLLPNPSKGPLTSVTLVLATAFSLNMSDFSFFKEVYRIAKGKSKSPWLALRQRC